MSYESYEVVIDPSRVAKNIVWWLIARGVIAAAFGVAVLVWQDSAAVFLIKVLGIFALIDGLIGIIGGLVGRHDAWGWTVFGGVLSLVLGLVMLRQTDLALLALVLLIAAWSLVTGLFMIFGSFKLRQLPGAPWVLVLIGGLVNAAIGVFLFIDPIKVGTILWIFIGAYGLFVGVLMLIAAIFTRSQIGKLDSTV
jgi:uncharacterized membrane protein HdeD (DUF308 family)